MNASREMDRVLIVDDDVELCGMLVEYLEPEGFKVDTAHDGERGAERALAGDFALIILDVMLPEGNGFEVLRRIRAGARTPVLMLTARGEDVDRIVGLELGADDYLAKPFNPRELVARIRAILRRTHPAGGEASTPAKPERLALGDVELDAGTRTVRCRGEAVELTATEFNLMDVLLRNAGRIVKREDLSQRVLGREFRPYDRSIDVHVSSLRRKLGHEVAGTERIKTIRGVGYIYANPDTLSNE